MYKLTQLTIACFRSSRFYFISVDLLLIHKIGFCPDTTHLKRKVLFQNEFKLKESCVVMKRRVLKSMSLIKDQNFPELNGIYRQKGLMQTLMGRILWIRMHLLKHSVMCHDV